MPNPKNVSFICLMVLLACGGGGPGASPVAPPSPPAPPVPPALAALHGVVREDFSGDSVPGATITVGSNSVTAGPDGRFQINGVPVGTPVVTVTAAGFTPYSQNVPTTAPASFVTITVMRADAMFEDGGVLLYLPPGPATIRGIFLHLYGNTNDSRPLLRGQLSFYQGNFAGFVGDVTSYRRGMLAFARANGLALMGAAVTSVDQRPDTYVKMLEALTSISVQSGRPELAHVPIVVHGMSLGGCIAYEMAVHHPDRVIGFIAAKSPCLALDGAPARSVPGYLILGGADPFPGIAEHIAKTYEQNRTKGAVWAFGIERDGGHTMVANHALLFNWMTDVVNRRLPAVIIPGAPVVLLAVDAATGWLGDQSAFAIAAYRCYGGNASSASWLPSERSAREWQEMISRGATTTVTTCGP